VLSASDAAGAPPAAVINRAMAERWWPGQPAPIGRHIRLPGGDWMPIAGVVAGIHTSFPDSGPSPTVYVPYDRFPETETDFALRISGDPGRLISAVRSAVRAVDREAPITNLNTMAELIRQESFGLAYIAGLMGIFGLVGLALSAIGVYGMMAHMVASASHEIGIRAALGARPRRVLGMIFLRGMKVTGAGLAIGLLPTIALARVLSSAVLNVAAAPGALLLVPLVLAMAAALATYMPARRALSIDPLAALKEE
jgi:predicted lysophospholipase L1 biosynthesis ABC-type transport system permease subunit